MALPAPELASAIGTFQRLPDANNLTRDGKLFDELSQGMRDLDRQLATFTGAARQLGGSLEVLNACETLREQLSKTLVAQYDFGRRARIMGEDPGGFQEFHEILDQIMSIFDHEAIDKEMGNLALSVAEFRNCLERFSEYLDESSNGHIDEHLWSWENHLSFLSSCLTEHLSNLPPKDDLRNREAIPRDGGEGPSYLERYMHRRSSQMLMYIDNLVIALKLFIEIGLPTIEHEQKRSSENLLNITTAATFFSAVSATTIQIQYSIPNNETSQIVNTFWFCSLVFSIGAALNSLLCRAWQGTIYASRGEGTMALALSMWMKRSPLLFLIISIITFLTGLVLFSYRSSQLLATSLVTAISTAITSFGLGVITLWMGYGLILERTRRRSRNTITSRENQRWTGLTLTSLTTVKLPSLSQVSLLRPVFRPTNTIKLQRALRPMTTAMAGKASAPLLRYDTLPSVHSWWSDSNSRNYQVTLRLNAWWRFRRDGGDPEPGDEMFTGTKNKPFVFSSPLTPRMLNGNRICKVQITPDGNHFATTLYSADAENNTETIIFGLQKQSIVPYDYITTIRHEKDEPQQLFWSPNGNGNELLVQFKYHVDYYKGSELVCEEIWKGNQIVQAVAWFPDGHCFVVVERNSSHYAENTVIIVGTKKSSRPFGASSTSKVFRVPQTPNSKFAPIQLRDIGVAEGGISPILIAVGYVTPPPSTRGFEEEREYRIFVFHLPSEGETLKWIRSIPIAAPPIGVRVYLSAATDILAEVLISYQKASPELWDVSSMDLKLRQSYSQTISAEFYGQYSLGGVDNNLVVYADTDKNVYLWDRDSGETVHGFPKNLGSEMEAQSIRDALQRRQTLNVPTSVQDAETDDRESKQEGEEEIPKDEELSAVSEYPGDRDSFQRQSLKERIGGQDVGTRRQSPQEVEGLTKNQQSNTDAGSFGDAFRGKPFEDPAAGQDVGMSSGLEP